LRQAAKIVAYAAAVVILGCALAPLLWWGGRALVDSGSAPFLAEFAFPKYFNRAVLVSALLLAWPLLRWLGVRSWRELGLDPNPRRFVHLGTGWGIAVTGLMLVALLLLAIGKFKLRKHWHMDTIVSRTISAWVVAVIEESFFRGALLGVLRRHLPWPKALAFVSVFFGCLHFVRPPKHFAPMGEITVWSGFELLPQLLWQWGNPRLVVGGLLTLILVGAILGYSVIKTRSLYFAVGLHAGWVMALKIFDHLAKRKMKVSFWFGRDLVTGLGPVLMLGLTFAVVALVLRRLRPGGIQEASS
jgi:uncharacterized protein